ncbi:MAG: bifunctional riboflavin kinase/FAD synthetase [Caldisericia bacterium]|nr:bifunctional riboflavin kinase/FAD synthetase [Caldisericia bacterium]
MNRLIGCIGNFDGVHTGHQLLIEITIKKAKAENTKPVLVTFASHTRYSKNDHIFLTTCEERNKMIRNIGIEKIVELDFPGIIATMTPKEFVVDILIQTLQIKHIVVGENFCFGKDRAGSVKTLQTIGYQYGLEVTIVPLKKINSEVVCSSKIRELIKNDQLAFANEMLGYPYSLSGMVVKGNQRGRTLGIPTANLHVYKEEKIKPNPGVYLTYTCFNDEVYESITHIGHKPTFNEAESVIETFVLSYSGNFYNIELTILWLEKIREVHKFTNGENLVHQIKSDVKEAQLFFSNSTNHLYTIPKILKRN